FTFYVHHARCAYLWAFYPVNKFINLLAGVRSGFWHGYTDNQFRTIEYSKFLMLCYGVQFAEFHAETDVGLVVSVCTHRFVKSHARELRNIDLMDGFQ